MDEAEQIIDPLVVQNGVDRIRRMGEEERSQLALQLVRFLAILYAEILRMVQMVDQDDGTSLLQMPGSDHQGEKVRESKRQGDEVMTLMVVATRCAGCGRG